MDCMELMARYPDKHFDLAIVDPPYGINADKNQETRAGKRGEGKNAGTFKLYHSTEWDATPPPQRYFDELQRVAKAWIVWGGNYFPHLTSSGIVVWYKGGSGKYKEGELAKTNINTFKVFQYSRADAYINDCPEKIHPTQKPVKLYDWLLQNYAEKGQKILDTHMGSGSIAIACHYAKCHLTASELDEDYFNAACERIERETRQQTLFD